MNFEIFISFDRIFSKESIDMHPTLEFAFFRALAGILDLGALFQSPVFGSPYKKR